VVLIQIGANDLPGKGPERETIPGPVPDPLPTEGLGSQALDWFRLNITRFVEESRAMKALPLLATQPERHEFEAYSATPLCRNRRYAQAIRAVAADLHVPLLELDRYSLDLYARFGVMGAQAMHYIKPEGDVDHSHFNAMGASIYAEKVAEFLIDQVPVLATAYRKPATPTVAHLKPNHTVMESIIGKA
jgi:lysophospholipase L1-like esterase